jgi:acyl-coenzyme A thioesterase PaaI-like protein
MMADFSGNPAGEKIQAKRCFVCGRDNPRGLKIPFFHNKDTVTARYAPDSDLCGFDGIVHGGILFALADEAMMHLIWSSGLRAVTAEVTMRFHGYAEAGMAIDIRAHLTVRSPRLLKAICRLSDEEGIKIASASGKFLPISPDEEKRFKKSY